MLTEPERESWEKWVEKAKAAWEQGQPLLPIHTDLILLVNEHLEELEKEIDQWQMEAKERDEWMAP